MLSDYLHLHLHGIKIKGKCFFGWNEFSSNNDTILDILIHPGHVYIVGVLLLMQMAVIHSINPCCILKVTGGLFSVRLFSLTWYLD